MRHNYDAPADTVEDTADFPPLEDLESFAPPEPFSSQVQVDLAARSDVGKVRTNNEDAFLVWRYGRSWEKLLSSLPAELLPEKFSETAYVMAVADGMGGMAGGEVASRLVLRTGVSQILRAVKWALRLDEPERKDEEIREGFERAAEYFRNMNKALIEHGREHPELAGMGTTLTALYSCGDEAASFHIGDSRAYLFRQGVLHRLTRDHTVAQALADMGDIKPSQIATHRMRHVLTHCLGGEGDPHVDMQNFDLYDGDRLLLCTDGLTEMLPDDQIAKTLERFPASADACSVLVDLALSNGGKDNVTVVLGRYTIPERRRGNVV